MKRNVENAKENLKRNGFIVKYFETSQEAKAALLEEIDVKESVGFGGSVTLTSMGMVEAFLQRGNETYSHNKVKNHEEKKEILRNAAKSDVYLCSSNAITEDGRLVNIDGSGNRLSSMLYGHKRVYFVVGTNKITKNVEEALIRIKNITCPQNTERLDLNTPCRETGKCSNCESPQRICNATLIIERKMMGADMTIYLINESLGY